MDNFFTWQTLATLGGATLAVTGFTQFFKGMIPVKIPTRLVAYILSVIILIAANYFTNGRISWSDTTLCLLNALVVSLAANGAHDALSQGK